MDSLWTASFWKAAIERAAKTAAQAVILSWTASTGGPGNLYHLDWKVALLAAGGGALLSVLTSIISIPAGSSGGPSFGDAETPAK